jgi:hypothetical protein
MIAMSVEPVEIDGKWFVDVTAGGRKLKKRGPFKDTSAAEAEADRIISEWAPAVPTTTNGTVILNGKPVELTSDLGRKLIVLACRAAENLISDAELRAELEIFDDVEFKAISESPAFIKALRQERFARINSGRALRESAAKIVAKGPAQLGRHLDSPATSPKHLVEIHKELRQTAHGGDGAESPAGAAERFSIVFHLGSDVERLEKEITPKPPRKSKVKPSSRNDVDDERFYQTHQRYPGKGSTQNKFADRSQVSTSRTTFELDTQFLGWRHDQRARYLLARTAPAKFKRSNERGRNSSQTRMASPPPSTPN